MDKQAFLNHVMTAAPVVPVVIVNDVAQAVSMSRALLAGGLPAIEITLRTPNAIDCIKAVADEVEGAIPGAGTVLSAEHMAAVEKAGAKFMVSPGTAPKLIDAALDCSVPLLPGTATASEMMALGEKGFTHVKFFPAEAAGGTNYLKSIASPLPQFRFCPTGGVSMKNAGSYLSLPNVLCVGGSWVAPANLVEEGDWAGIEALAAEASRLTRAA